MRIKALLKSYFLPQPDFKVNQKDRSEDVLGPIQARISTSLLRLSFVLGTIILLIGYYPSIQADLMRQYIGALVSVVIVAFLLYFSNLSHHKRSFFLMGTAYLFLLSTIFNGVSELTFVMLFSFVVMVSLLIGIKSGAVAIVISILTMVGTFWGLNQDFLFYRLDFFELKSNFLGLFLFSIYWLFFVSIYILTAWVYLDGFNILFKREQEARVQMKAERDLLAQASEREKRLISQLEHSYHQVSELSKIKSQMITVVAHEFRTPLTVIKSSSELLTAHLDRLSDEKRERIQTRINGSVLSLNQLLQDMEHIDLKGNSEIQVKLAVISRGAFQNRIEKFFENEFGEFAINLAWNVARLDSDLMIDAELIERILSHIILNALKFSPKNSKIAVKFDIGDEMIICVTDLGIGIEAEELSRIWEPFYRAENAQAFRGMGLGLSFVSLIVDVLEGEITAISQGANKGSEFKIKLPC